MIKHKKSDDKIVSKVIQLEEKDVRDDKTLIKVQNNITPYMAPQLK